MFNKKMIASITIDHNKLMQQEKDSCIIKILDTKDLLNEEDEYELKNYLNSACDLLRKAYIKRLENKKEMEN